MERGVTKENFTGLLASPGLLSLISYTTHQCLLRDGTYPSRWGTLTSINNQENGPQAWLQAILMEALSQLRTLLQMTIRCITLTEINNDNKKPSPQNKQTKNLSTNSHFGKILYQLNSELPLNHSRVM